MYKELNGKAFRLGTRMANESRLNNQIHSINTLPYFNHYVGNIQRTSDETEYYITNDYITTDLRVTPVIFFPHYKLRRHFPKAH